MKPWNASSRPFEQYLNTAIRNLDDVMDFSRSLENLAHVVVQPWRVLPVDSYSQPPTPVDAGTAPAIRIGEPGGAMRAWLCTYLPRPPLAALFDAAHWGNWRIQLDSDGLGDIHVDGRCLHRDLFLHGTRELVPATDSGTAPWIAFRLDTTIQKVALEMARASFSGLEEANGLIRDVARSLRTAANLLKQDNPRVNRFLSGEVRLNRSPIGEEERSRLEIQLLCALRKIDIPSYINRDRRRFLASVKECRDALAPLAEFAKRFTVFLFGVSHMDLAWKWRWPETIECMRGTLENQVRFMEKHRDFTFLESSPPVWIALREYDPKLYEKLVKFGKKGQFEPAGGMWCEPDGQMLSAESWVRQCLFGQRAAREILGCQSRAGHNTDAFGFSWALPKIYAQAGMEAFLTQKMRYNEFTVFEEVLFWWESDDGSRILGIHTYPDHYQEIDPDEIAQATRIFHVTSGVFSSALLFGIGNHGGGPLPDMFDRIEEMRRLTVYPNVRMGGMNEYLDYLKKNEADALKKLPVLRDELFLECHHKTYTVQAATKAANREIERTLFETEALAVMAGRDCRKELKDAWEVTLFNQFHDILPGTSFPSVYQDVMDEYDAAFDWADGSADVSLAEMLGEDGVTQYLVNTLPWRRSACVCLEMDEELPEMGYLQDDAGNRFPYQRTGFSDEIAFCVPELPAFGVRSISICRDGNDRVSREGRDFSYGETFAANRFFRAEFDPARGYVVSLKLADGAELAGDGIGRLDLLEDSPEGFYQTWNMNLTGREDIAKCESFELVEGGPVRARFVARMSHVRWEKKKDFMVPIMWTTPGVDYPTSFFDVEYIIWKDREYIECILHTDWWEEDTDLKVAAGTNFETSRAFYSIPFGKIERPTRRNTPYEKARYEVPALNWADLTDGNRGVAILNAGRHGHDALNQTLRLTLLTSPYGGEKVHVPDPLADRGRHTIRYAFFPHCGGPDQAEVARVAQEFECQAISHFGEEEDAAIRIGEDRLVVDPGKTLPTAIKPSEDGKGIVVRLYEPYGRETSVPVNGPLAVGTPKSIDFLENVVADSAPSMLKPHGVVSLRFK